MTKKSAYIVTKPIQYINATNIQDVNIKDCYITNTFKDVESFTYHVVKYSKRWEKVYNANSKAKALVKILKSRSQYSSLYIDSDVGIILRILLVFLFPIKVFVYEEGLASYLKDIRRNKETLLDIVKFIIDPVFGRNYSGGSYRTTGIYLYHPQAFLQLMNLEKSQKLKSFRQQSLLSHIHLLHEFESLYRDEILNDFKEKNVVLYLTSWIINPKYKEILGMYKNFSKIIKIHPHINYDVSHDLLMFDYSALPTIPAELLIAKLARIAKTLVIIHEGTAAMLNFINVPEIIEYNIANDDYLDIYINIKNKFQK